MVTASEMMTMAMGEEGSHILIIAKTYATINILT
jgi:hypothetical protein